MLIGAGCVLGAFIAGVVFGEKVKAYVKLKFDALIEKLNFIK